MVVDLSGTTFVRIHPTSRYVRVCAASLGEMPIMEISGRFFRSGSGDCRLFHGASMSILVTQRSTHGNRQVEAEILG